MPSSSTPGRRTSSAAKSCPVLTVVVFRGPRRLDLPQARFIGDRRRRPPPPRGGRGSWVELPHRRLQTGLVQSGMGNEHDTFDTNSHGGHKVEDDRLPFAGRDTQHGSVPPSSSPHLQRRMGPSMPTVSLS
nr:unnamed protein product [Digitaria exilis]